MGDTFPIRSSGYERKASITPPVWNRPPPLPTAPTSGTLDVTLVTADEVAAIRHYLERRSQLDEPIRRDIARTMAERLRPKVGGAPDDLRGEPFLVAVVTTKLERPS